jgi:3-dehydroquinate synthetase
MQKDKKKGKLGLRFVTLSEIGVVTRCEDVTAEELKELFLSKVGR